MPSEHAEESCNNAGKKQEKMSTSEVVHYGAMTLFDVATYIDIDGLGILDAIMDIRG